MLVPRSLIPLSICAAVACAPADGDLGASTSAAEAARQPRLRVLSFNTFLTPPVSGSEAAYRIPQTERAELIAHQLIAADADVVALYEVNDEDARDVLVNRLSPLYPHYLQKADTDNVVGEDSGLMLFSRRRFLPLDGSFPGPGTGSFGEDYYEAENAGHPFAIAWRSFPGDMKNGDDWWANKGVAFARIELDAAAPHDSFVIGLTHMQSDNLVDGNTSAFGEDVEDRNLELQFARELYEEAVAQPARLRELAIFAGDLNINGAQEGATQVHGVANQPVYFISSISPNLPPVEGPFDFNEWQLAFGPRRAGTEHAARDAAEGFFACASNRARSAPCTYDGRHGSFFADSWAGETSELDLGQTSSGANTGGALVFDGPTDGERLDYILHNTPSEPTGTRLCLQHIRRGFADRGADILSDHLPLLADFNAHAPQCSVRPRLTGDPLRLHGDDDNPPRADAGDLRPRGPDRLELSRGGLRRPLDDDHTPGQRTVVRRRPGDPRLEPRVLGDRRRVERRRREPRGVRDLPGA
jgi:hypothetical protein